MLEILWPVSFMHALSSWPRCINVIVCLVIIAAFTSEYTLNALWSKNARITYCECFFCMLHPAGKFWSGMLHWCGYTMIWHHRGGAMYRQSGFWTINWRKVVYKSYKLSSSLTCKSGCWFILLLFLSSQMTESIHSLSSILLVCITCLQ